MKRKPYKRAQQIETTELCKFGCGQIAKYVNGQGGLACEVVAAKCPENRKKNGAGNKGKVSGSSRYASFSQETKDRMNWAKGLSKDIDPRVTSPHMIGKKFGAALNGHTQETKDKLSTFKTAWLRNPDNHKKIERKEKSWMELCFEKWLRESDVSGWDDEVHFWNSSEGKNYFVDYLFEDKKLILELDGTQHRHTIEKDKIRDEYLESLGYTVKRVPYSEFKTRYFSDLGFKDLLGD